MGLNILCIMGNTKQFEFYLGYWHLTVKCLDFTLADSEMKTLKKTVLECLLKGSLELYFHTV